MVNETKSTKSPGKIRRTAYSATALSVVGAAVAVLAAPWKFG
jgi:hypothetical protein